MVRLWDPKLTPSPGVVPALGRTPNYNPLGEGATFLEESRAPNPCAWKVRVAEKMAPRPSGRPMGLSQSLDHLRRLHCGAWSQHHPGNWGPQEGLRGHLFGHLITVFLVLLNFVLSMKCQDRLHPQRGLSYGDINQLVADGQQLPNIK